MNQSTSLTVEFEFEAGKDTYLVFLQLRIHNSQTHDTAHRLSLSVSNVIQVYPYHLACSLNAHCNVALVQLSELGQKLSGIIFVRFGCSLFACIWN